MTQSTEERREGEQYIGQSGLVLLLRDSIGLAAREGRYALMSRWAQELAQLEAQMESERNQLSVQEQ
jgi:hypothetical protein